MQLDHIKTSFKQIRRDKYHYRLFLLRALAIELSVKTGAYVRVTLQIKDITVFALRALPQLIVNKVITTF